MKKVILIDDNKDILSMWKMFLDKLGYDSVTLESLGQFRDFASKEGLGGVGCVICDESLQDGLGSELFESLQKEGVHVPFVIVSGYGEEEILAKVSAPEKLTVLKKPISLKSLKNVIDSSFGQDSASL